jgi:hypothetical protein
MFATYSNECATCYGVAGGKGTKFSCLVFLLADNSLFMQPRNRSTDAITSSSTSTTDVNFLTTITSYRLCVIATGRISRRRTASPANSPRDAPKSTNPGHHRISAPSPTRTRTSLLRFSFILSNGTLPFMLSYYSLCHLCLCLCFPWDVMILF